MYESAVAAGSGLISTYGLVVLFVIFALEGALIGKIIPTRALFVSAVLVLGTGTFGLVSVFLVAVLGATVGQLLVFTLVRRTSVSTAELPGVSKTGPGARVQGWFDRWGLSAVAVTNVLPVVRGTLTVPAAMADDSVFRFSTAAVAGTAVYAGGLILVAVGLETLTAVLSSL